MAHFFLSDDIRVAPHHAIDQEGLEQQIVEGDRAKMILAQWVAHEQREMRHGNCHDYARRHHKPHAVVPFIGPELLHRVQHRDPQGGAHQEQLDGRPVARRSAGSVSCRTTFST